MAGIDDMAPLKNARQFVNDVMLIDGPACLKASFRRYSGVFFNET